MFILSACFLCMACGRSVSTESPLWDSIDDKFQTRSLQEENQGAGDLQLADKEPSSNQHNTSSESALETTTPTRTANTEVGIIPKPQSAFNLKRLRRNGRKPEGSCLLGKFKKELPGGTIVAYPVCSRTAAHNKCIDTLRNYGSRACEPSNYEKVDDNGTIRAIPTTCSCKL